MEKDSIMVLLTQPSNTSLHLQVLIPSTILQDLRAMHHRSWLVDFYSFIWTMPFYLSSIWAILFFYHFSIPHLSRWVVSVWIHSQLASHLALLAVSMSWCKQNCLVRWSGSTEQGRCTLCRAPVSSPALLYTQSCGFSLNFRVEWMASSSLAWWSKWVSICAYLVLMVPIHFTLRLRVLLTYYNFNRFHTDYDGTASCR
jgi:hypothetical protein